MSVQLGPEYAEMPIHLLDVDAPTKLLNELGRDADYRYAHDEERAFTIAGENHFPAQLKGKRYYFPVERGLEIKTRDKLAFLRILWSQFSSPKLQ
jgi:putative ATPase